jgi:hypothetical protein
VINKLVGFAALTALLGACSPPVPANPSEPGAGKIVFTGDQKADWTQITALEDQAKALVHTTGCASVDQCRTAAVGSRACGGPRYYLVYCAASTDSTALFAKLVAVAAAERQYNQHYNIASTCEFRMPPKVALSGASCQAQPAQ